MLPIGNTGHLVAFRCPINRLRQKKCSHLLMNAAQRLKAGLHNLKVSKSH
ncbi:hypothetical protein SL1157_2413 [Ruegeria lacuscaerulensis ITI-1157]|nr:hypothetical protein SL1157_2413 [Ruegeria lacuscaerulensis ITI-1157]